MDYINVKNTRCIEVKYLPPTNYRGSRIKISDKYREKTESKTFSFCYETGNVLQQAVDILTSNNIEIVSRASTINNYLLNIDSWGENFFHIKNLK